jgi:hypothetical protein
MHTYPGRGRAATRVQTEQPSGLTHSAPPAPLPGLMVMRIVFAMCAIFAHTASDGGRGGVTAV